MAKQSFSKYDSSELIRLFVQRSGFSSQAPEYTIRALAAALSEGSSGDLDTLLPRRNIDKDILLTEDLPGDGMIEPKGRSFRDGFTMRLRLGQPASRLRFTKAHEICHTFFYELAPELKFTPHRTDAFEERLCNIGAEELLMPMTNVCAEVSGMPVSIGSLMSLSRHFGVSLSAMLLRLRQAWLWDCELTYWHRMLDGSFVLDRKTGGRKANWEMNSSILNSAWESGPLNIRSGVTNIYFEHGAISSAVRVYYQATRYGDCVITLWSKRKLRKRQRLPLFRDETAIHAPKKRRSKISTPALPELPSPKAGTTD